MMDIFHSQPQVLHLSGCEVYLTSTEFLYGDGAFMRALELISEPRKNRVIQYANRERASQSAAAELLLRHALILQGFYESPEFGVKYKGKPYLLNLPHISFSLSHTTGLAACAVTENGEVGLDAERVRDVNMRIADKLFTPSEREKLFAAEEPQKSGVFIDIWARKESIYKALGGGVDVRGFDVYDGKFGIDSVSYKNYRIAVCIV